MKYVCDVIKVMLYEPDVFGQNVLFVKRRLRWCSKGEKEMIRLSLSKEFKGKIFFQDIKEKAKIKCTKKENCQN